MPSPRNAELLVLTSYFNAEHFQSRRANFATFETALREAGVPLFTVECAFGDDDFELAPSRTIAQVRSSAVLWQKERLLNLGLQLAPPEFEFIAWIDADVLFEDRNVFARTIRLLERHPVVQMFDTVARLPRGQQVFIEGCTAWKGFGARACEMPDSHHEGWFRHGHTGFAWAARREVLSASGFFDNCLSGANDHLIAHACMGDWYSKCIDELLGLGSPMHAEFRRWGRTFFPLVKGNVGFTPGRALHLWHGDDKHRVYHKWTQQFKACHPDPARDFRVSKSGCLEWTGANPALEAWSRGLFSGRKEDG